MRRLPAVLAAVSLPVAACTGGGGGVRRPDGIAVEHVATSAPLPLSQNNDLALIARDTACVFDSWEVQIVCGDREWRRTVRLGREGAGPGELGRFGMLLRGPQSSVAFLDLRNRRVALFRVDGPTSEWGIGTQGTPAGPVQQDSALVLHSQPAPGGPPVVEVVRTDLRTGDVAVRTRLRAAHVEGGDVVLSGVVVHPAGGYVARVESDGTQHLALYASDGAFEGLLAIPRGELVYPSDADVEQYVDQYSRALLGQRPPDSLLREYRRTRCGGCHAARSSSSCSSTMPVAPGS